MLGVKRLTWEWRFDQPPEKIWPIFSDTARFNEAAGLPSYQVREIPQANGNILRLASAKVGGVLFEWDDRPYEWVQNRNFSQTRIFRNGPLKTFGPIFELRRDGGGTVATYSLLARPGGIVGWLLLRLGFLEKGGRMIKALIKSATAHLAGDQAPLFEYAPPRLPQGAAERVAATVTEIEKTIYGHGLAARLGDFLLHAQEVDLAHMRPLKLGRDWGVEPRFVVELCFEATRAGLLKLSWDLLCPRCRGAKSSTSTLDQLPNQAHCPSCNIVFDANFSKNVELSFRPSPTVRDLSSGEFCLSGPHTTPHVVVQQILEPGEERGLAATLAPGPYRLRTLAPGGEVDVDFPGDGFPTFIVEDDRISLGGPAPPETLHLVNRSGREIAFVIESRAWVAEALTAHRATTMQAFRDLLPEQALRPAEHVEIDNVTLMFTDLASSTSLYERVGDGQAYRLVRDHFDFLADAVRRNNGAIVKTIGDAVMAAFSEPADAVRTALDIQGQVTRFNANHGGEAITIKIGLHGGACIAVTMNERLDYFGSTVNIAARLQGQSQGGDVVLSERLSADPAVSALLGDRPVTTEIAQLKGIARAVTFRRLLGDGRVTKGGAAK
ncbi:MAG TPA: adenylate/guanylate cyclase domain-containing protein [Alphaproteobacteria bacterium]|nr:adenylate/guanylate cyclase domain-containing protein [Alphaproteobacteria bacterium]